MAKLIKVCTVLYPE